ncbi:uncharacterized protein si:dkey-262k9.2 [Danio rerio]|uniref:Si:dkey-262k9.2 n=2 Tax=Danio rerio TaxID=7955 RepID=X1WGZ4_DANRE|nr:uncharacterized protein si:dkey-262k9.2 [Danio rerio]XP_005157837.1 uncharacterized protein si:dkey-262k9.2 [Danio rerio]|eukprot:XP_002664710.1 uncharacterized protein si:dkey-262k9.2 [Danio rerio]
MLRLLIVVLILQGVVAASDDTEGNASGYPSDDEDEVVTINTRPVQFEPPQPAPGSDKSKGDNESGDGILIIIIAAVSVAVLAIGSIAAIFLLRRHLQSREQGVYSVPAEQGHKAAV